MKHLVRFYLVLIILSIGCTFKKTVKVTDTNFKEEITRNQELVFTFNVPVVNDSLVNIWDTTRYITFDPPVDGRFKWTSMAELLFSPASTYNPCCKYMARLNPDALKNIAVGFSVPSQEFSFHTPYLNLSSANAYWALNEAENTRVEIRIRLQFNNTIDPGMLSNLLHIDVLEKPVTFNLVGANRSDLMEIAIPEPIEPGDDNINIGIMISPGLGCGECGWKSVKTIESEITIPPKDQLQVREMSAYFEGGYGIIHVLTSQPVDRDNLIDLISIDPPVDYKTELTKAGFIIKGDFMEGLSYKVTLSGDIKGVFGKTMGKPYSQYVTFGSLEPYIAFTDKASRYLSLKGNRNIGVQIVNVPKVRISVFKVFENNIQHYLREGKSYEWEYADDRYFDFYDYGFNEDYGQTVFSKVIETAQLPKSGNIRLLTINPDAINISNLLKGIYLLKVESTEKSWLRDVQLFAISDLGLMVRQGTNKMLVYVHSIKDASPVAGAMIHFMSKNNQLVYSATTDNQGIVELKDLRTAAPGFTVAMVTAHKDNDFNYILFNESVVETSRFDVGGKRTAGLVYDVFIYGDRDIYRPGDTVYFNTVVRTMNWKTEGNIPVKIKVLRPDGRVFSSFRKTLDGEGAADSRLILPADAMTGSYTIEVYSGNDVLLKSMRILVEEFLPDRIKVIATTDKTDYRSDEEIKLDINALNLFGTPASGRNFETELQLSPKLFSPKDCPGYAFGVSLPDNRTFEKVVRQGSTDEKGNASETFQVAGYKNIGILQANIFTTVFDETGRPVNRLSTVNIFTQDIFFGIRQFDRWIDTRKPIDIALIAVDKEGRKVSNIPVHIQIVQFSYETIIEHTGYSYNYKSERVERIMRDQVMTMDDDPMTFSFIPVSSGSYEVRVMSPGSEGYVSQEFYAYGWGDTEYTSFEVSREGQVIIEPDRQEYEPGQVARILFKAPFDGKLLITVERDEVLESHVVTTDNKAASINLTIKGAFMPNIYITATLFRPHNGNDLPLTVAHGFASLKVTDPEFRLPLEINAISETRSKKRQEVKVKTLPGAEVTIAVVDEGILQVTDFSTPDPYDYFYQKRALEVTPCDIYAFLFPELGTNLSKTGGDIGAGIGKRISPVTGRRAHLLAYWSGILKTNAGGECRFSFDIPQFSGSLRIMAVAFKKEKFASASKNIQVADPLVISTALPRFLSPGDKAIIPVTITNTTGQSATASINIELKGPVSLDGENTQTIRINPNSEHQVVYTITAGPDIGEAEMTVNVKVFNELFSDNTFIPVRPPAGLTRVSGAGSINGGDSVLINVKTDFISATAASKLILSKTPVVQFSECLTSLLEYPYGCSEQLISKGFPLIFYADLAKMASQENKGMPLNPEYIVQEVIKKIQALQVYNGGLLLWPQGGVPNWWVTAYGAHFLYEARQAGFPIDDKILENMIRYLELKVRDKSTDSYYYKEISGQYIKRSFAKKEIFYSLYVMALTGHQNLSLMNYYKAHPELLDVDSRYLLSTAFLLAGDQEAFRSTLPKAFGEDQSQRSLGGSFNSYLRDMAISLYSLVEANPADQQIPILAKAVSGELKKGGWLSTQEQAFALMALGKMAHASGDTRINAIVNIDGQKAGEFTGQDLVLSNDMNNKAIRISASGEGILYYFYDVEGVSATGQVRQEDSYMEVRKAFFDRFGRPLTGNVFEQNDLVVVKISVRSTLAPSIENVAVTDLLPACFEIENPRITPERELNWIKDKSDPGYMDIRDDRIIFFVTESAEKNNRYDEVPETRITREKWTNFYYTVRAVSKGTYEMGPVSAEAMYDGQYHSAYGAVVVRVN